MKRQSTPAERGERLRKRVAYIERLIANPKVRTRLPADTLLAIDSMLSEARTLLFVDSSAVRSTDATDQRYITLSLASVFVDPPRFQPRERLDTERVKRMAETWDERAYTPIVVWSDPNDGKYYVLAGHHRLAALKIMGRREALVQVFTGDEAAAIAWAWESNAHSAAQSSVENARYLRRLFESGLSKADVRRRCKDLYDANCTTSWLLSHLHADGEAARRLSEWSRDSEGYRDMETMARWVGAIRETLPNLTVAQENEITRHLFDNFKTVGRRFRSSNDYESFVQSQVRRRYPDGIEPHHQLMLVSHASKTDGEKRIDSEIAEAKADLEAARAKLAKMQSDIARSKEENAFGLTQEGIERALTKANTDVVEAEQRLLALRRDAADVRAEGHLYQHALFDDDMNQRLTTLQTRFRRISTLVSAVEAKIPETQAAVVRSLLSEIGAVLGIDATLPERKPERATLYQIEPGPHDTLGYDTYARRVGAVVRKQIIAELEPQIARLSSVSADKKASDSRRSAARAERDDLKKQITRLRNDDVEPGSEAAKRIEATTRSLYEASGGRLTPEQIITRLTELHEIAFTEESKSEDFYPTPDDIIERYLIPRANLQPGNTVLEPSAGRGNIARAVRRACEDCDISVVEINSVRREILALEGFRVVGTDFWDFAVAGRDAKNRPVLDPGYKFDRIIMNPPFDGGVGLAHIKRAYELLEPGGTLVAIMPEGYLFGTSRQNTDFQQWAKKSGALEFEVINKDEYNANHDRKIMIHIALLTIVKPAMADVIVDADAVPATKALDAFANERVQIPGDEERTVDTEFVPPEIVTASANLARKAQENYIPQDLATLPFLKQHVIDGANLAIESLSKSTGFLLADGTGTGKTIQSLLVAEHFYRTTGQPVLIFTVDERVLATSFGDDARKLGFRTPNISATTPKDKIPQRPKSYAGLYDGAGYTLPDGNTVDVWRHGFGQPLRPGINLCTYHDLSQYKGGEGFVEALKEAQRERREVEREYRQKRKEGLDALDRKYPKDPRTGKRPKGIKDETEALKTRLDKEYNEDHPSLIKLYAAQKAYTTFLEGAVAEFAGATQLIIFDEAHKVKNAGDGVDAGSRRAELALILINYCPKVMYVTATPADRPFDILYLKKAGLFKDDSQFKSLMYEIGYEWKEPKTNENGDTIADGGWRLRGGSGDIDGLLRANAALSSSFDMLTEDGQMLRREIQMTNLTVEMHKFAAPPAALSMMDDIEAAYTEVDEQGRETKDLMQIYGRQLEELEPYKLAKTVELVDDAVKRGKQVIVFVQTVETGKEIREATGQEKPGAVRMLKDTLAKRFGEENVGVIVGTSGEYEDYRRMENVRDFQAGKRRILIGTITSGGTGLNLDDTTGRAPRELVIVTPPLSFINVVQAVGRIVRANTKSRSVAHFIFTSNTDVDAWLSRLIATKFASLNAVVKGETSRLDLGMIQKADNAGETGVVSAIAQATQTDGRTKASQHSRYSKRNQRVEGWSLPSQRPYYCELTGTPKNTLISLGAKTYTDLQAFMAQHADWIADNKLVLNPDEQYRRFNGPYLGWKGDRETTVFQHIWNAVLNMVDFEIMDKVVSATAQFAVGDRVTLAQDIVHAGAARGLVATVRAVREPRYDGDTWRYDVADDNGKDIKAVEGYKLHTAEQQQQQTALKAGMTFAWSDFRGYGRNYHAAIRIVEVTPFDVQYIEEWRSAPSYGAVPIVKAEDFSWPKYWHESSDRLPKTSSHEDLIRKLEDYDAVCVNDCDPWNARPKPDLPAVLAGQTWQWNDDAGDVIMGYIESLDAKEGTATFVTYDTSYTGGFRERIEEYNGKETPWRKVKNYHAVDRKDYTVLKLARMLFRVRAACVDGCSVYPMPDGGNAITTAVADGPMPSERRDYSLADDAAALAERIRTVVRGTR